MFVAFSKQADKVHLLEDIISGKEKFPDKPEDRDTLYFLAQSFRGRLWHDLPEKKQKMNKEAQYLAHRAKALIKDIALINMEIAQMVVSAEGEKHLPEWFMIEIIRDVPRLMDNCA